MPDPYRRRHDDPPDELEARRAELPTLGFGLLCAVLGAALAGADRVKCLLIATVAGSLLIAWRRDLWR